MARIECLNVQNIQKYQLLIELRKNTRDWLASHVMLHLNIQRTSAIFSYNTETEQRAVNETFQALVLTFSYTFGCFSFLTFLDGVSDSF